MGNALLLADMILRLWARFDSVMQDYKELKDQADAEGREISDEELDTLRQKSQDKLDALKAEIDS